MAKRITALLVLGAALALQVQAQTVSGRLVTSFLGWERTDTAGSTQYMRGYENVQLNLASGDFSFSTYMQGSTDFSQKMESDPQLRLFNAILQWKNIGGMADLKLGRQAIFGGVGYGTIDGALLRLRPAHGVEASLYGGGLTPAGQKAEFLKNVDNNWQAGAHVLLYLLADTKIGLSYMNRHRETSPYEGFRLDAQNNLTPQTIDYGSRANQYGSLDVAWSRDGIWAFGRADYDFNFERLSRAELAATYQVTDALGLTLDLAQREQTLAYNSYFRLLESEANQEAMVGIDYRVLPMITVNARFSHVAYENDAATCIALGASSKYASLMYTKDISYDGDLDGFNLQGAYPFLHGMLVPHLGVVYSSYALSEDGEKTSTLAGVAGATVRPWNSLSCDLEAQYMTNKIYKSDIRVFARINYWFAKTFGIGE
jgi:hypothetical protein